MNPLRLSLRFPLLPPGSGAKKGGDAMAGAKKGDAGAASPTPAPSQPFEAERVYAAAIDVFHRFIQRGMVEGLLIDVADYQHVPQGPGVLLVGHDIDYGVSVRGFQVVRKRQKNTGATRQLRDALRMGMGALRALEEDGRLGLAFDTTNFTVQVYDRAQAGSGAPAAAFAKELEAELAGPLAEWLGKGATITAQAEDDPREAPAFRIAAPGLSAAAPPAGLGEGGPPGQSPWDISVEAFKRLRDTGAELVLIDVREPAEFETVNLGGMLTPLATLPEKMKTLPKQAHIVVHCKAGGRGARAVQQLRDAGFDNAWNLAGGILAWSERIDKTLPRY